jgi:hypothetical protein
MTLLADLARVLRAAADEAEAIDREQRAERRDWVDQVSSPLGRRRHVAAVKRRIDRGLEGAAMVGRRALLSAAALEEELALLSKGPVKAKATKADDVTSRLERRLGLVGGLGK